MLSLELPSGVSYQALLEQARNLMVSMSVDAMLRLDETARTIAVLERENEDLEERARTDELTGLPNRAMLDALPRAAGARAPARGPARLPRRDPDRGRPASAHSPTCSATRAATTCSRLVAGALTQVTRDSEMLGRYGGEEFCVVVPHATPETLAEAARAAAGARSRRTTSTSARSASWKVTASFGCALLPEVTAAPATSRS